MPPEILEGLTATRIRVSFHKSIALSWRISADRNKFEFIGNFNFTIDFISGCKERKKKREKWRQLKCLAVRKSGRN